MRLRNPALLLLATLGSACGDEPSDSHIEFGGRYETARVDTFASSDAQGLRLQLLAWASPKTKKTDQDRAVRLDAWIATPKVGQRLEVTGESSFMRFVMDATFDVTMPARCDFAQGALAEAGFTKLCVDGWYLGVEEPLAIQERLSGELVIDEFDERHVAGTIDIRAQGIPTGHPSEDEGLFNPLFHEGLRIEMPFDVELER